MKERIEVTAQQASAVICVLTEMRDSAALNTSRLAMAKLGEPVLWLRLDALKAEFAEIIAWLQPTLFLE